MNHKAMELQVNTLVILILSIIIFGGGIAIFFKAFYKGQEQAFYLDQATQAEIDNALDNGDLVSIPRNSRTISKGGYADFGIGVNNEAGQDYNFKPVIAYSTAEPASAKYPGANPPLTWYVPQAQTEVLVKNNEHGIFKQRIIPKGAARGTHIFTVVMCYDGPLVNQDITGYCQLFGGGSGNMYGNVQKIYLTFS